MTAVLLNAMGKAGGIDSSAKAILETATALSNRHDHFVVSVFEQVLRRWQVCSVGTSLLEFIDELLRPT